MVEGGRVRTSRKIIEVRELKDIEFRAWLQKGDWTDKSISHRINVVRSLERLLADMEGNHSNLEEAFDDDEFSSLLNVLIEYKNDAKNGGQKYRALMPNSEKPSGRLSNAISFLKQYGRFLNGDSPPKASAEWPELLDLKQRFLTRCSDFQDFTQTSGTYWELEREYKDRMIQAVVDVAKSDASDTVAGEKILDILTFGKGLNINSGLPLGWQALDKVKKSEQEQRDAFFSIIGQLSRSDAPLSEAISTAGKGLSSLKTDGLTAITKGVILSNILCTIGCIRPGEACFAKSKILNKFGQFLTGQNLLSGRDFDVAEVETFLELIARIFLIMEEDWDWKPRDFFDVQSFAWAALDDRWIENQVDGVSGLTVAAVRHAMAECDQTGEAEFLSKYGFGDRMRYRVLDKGRSYPSKAIASVAFKFTNLGEVKVVNGGVWGPHDAGGMLKTLGFEIIDIDEKKDQVMTKTHPLNQILYGPPGTGKTWSSAKLAVEICDGQAAENRSDLMARYRELVEQKRIAFTTFHQSMGYEEFVEGLRPETGGGDEDSGASGGFRLESRNGIFREICALAKESGVKSKSSLIFDLSGRQYFKMSLGRAKSQNHIYEAALDKNKIAIGYGGEFDWSDPKFDSYEAVKAKWQEFEPEASGNNPNIAQVYNFRGKMRKGDIVIISDGNFKFRAIAEITGDYEYAEDGVFNDEMIGEGQLYPHQRAVKWLRTFENSQPYDAIKHGQFSQVSCYNISADKIKTGSLKSYISSVDAEKVSAKPDEVNNFVLIIDEINRANISKVFGELITLLEPDKRLGAGDNALQVTLPYSGHKFGVPKNLYILGTMNTADRSIALLDTALRRRFSFKEMMPDYSVIARTVEGIDLAAFLKALNNRIEWMFDRDHQIGHSYFTKVNSLGDLDHVLREKIIPLLTEYFYEDWNKVCVALNDTDNLFVKKEKLIAPKLQELEGEERFRFIMNDKPFPLEAYLAAYQS